MLHTGSQKTFQHALPCCAAGAVQGGLSVLPSEYPPVWRNETLVEDYPGGVVHDPYRWLEDTDSPQTRACAPMQTLLCVRPAHPCWMDAQPEGAVRHLGQATSSYRRCTLTCSSDRRCGTACHADMETVVVGAAAGCACSAAALGNGGA